MKKRERRERVDHAERFWDARAKVGLLRDPEANGVSYLVAGEGERLVVDVLSELLDRVERLERS